MYLSLSLSLSFMRPLGQATTYTYLGREFRDVVFEDVGFEHNSWLTLNTEGAGTLHLKLIWVRGFKHIMFKPQILKHHIPEHPTMRCVTFIPKP